MTSRHSCGVLSPNPKIVEQKKYIDFQTIRLKIRDQKYEIKNW